MKTLIIAILLCFGVPAAAEFVLVAEAHEVALRDLRLPGNANGTLSFKPCETCDYQTVRVTAATEYEANGRLYPLQEFRGQLENVRNPAGVTATVLHHLESDTIKAVRVKF
jgi:hypothetical protein